MKSSKSVGGWRPVLGVAVIGAMALSVVNALAGPRGTDQTTRGTGKGGTEVTRLVTGDPTQINAVVAGGPATSIMAVTPVNPPTGMPAYPAGVTIDGSQLVIDRAANKDGFRAWFNVQVSNWDPLGDGPNLATYQIKIDAAGYYQSDCEDVKPNNFCNGGANDGLACTTDASCPGGYCGLDLKPAFVACPGDDPTPCTVAFGESWAPCTAGVCDAGYLTLAADRPDSWCTPGGGGCNTGGVAIGTPNYNYFAVSNAIPGHPDQPGTCVGGTRPGQGCTAAAQCPGGGACTGPKLPTYYGGTLVLDLPAEAKGKYTVNLVPDETFVASPGTPPVVLDFAEKNGFQVNFVGGSCCYGLGTPLAGCIDACINRSDCLAQPAPRLFTPGATCLDGCVECAGETQELADDLCDDSDACTTERCDRDAGVCIRGFKAGFNPIKGVPGEDTGNCCNITTGALTAKDDSDACTRDACSAADNRGAATHTPAVGPCDDGNPCSVSDACNGTQSEEDGGCTGTDVNSISCASAANCPNDPLGVPYPCIDGKCFCTLTPKVTYVLDTDTAKTCVGGFTPGAPCAKDADCPGQGVCDLFPANCFGEGEKIDALVHVGAAGSPINGGQFLLEYDPSCVDFNSVRCLPPYTTTVYGPIVDEGKGEIFIACGVDAFAGVDGPLGNVNMLLVSFTMIGECNNCSLCFGGDLPPGDPGSNNPRNTYLVDDGGYKVGIEPQCKEIAEYGELVLTVPDNIAVNSDCDVPSANVSWDSPSATFSCGDTTLVCRGAHESGLALSQAVVYGGGVLPQGANSFCCYATSAGDKCDQSAGCAGDTNNCPATGLKPNGNMGREGCWTVDISDETSLDIHIQLEPPMAFDEQERCIEFCLYGNCAEGAICFEENVTFGGIYNYVGKAGDKIKIPKGKWGCITAQDQLHSLRSCDIPDCIDGQLVARFKGDPTYGGNWLIMGNLDAYKKSIPGEDPSLDVIDILDFGKFVASYGVCYEDRTYGCHEGTHGDINGDGCTTLADYNFIIRNFMVSAKDCCCGPTAAELPPALTEVTVDELRQMGEAELIVADLNGDGVVNGDDMEAFTQGVRPAKPIDRKGGKGLRSGR